MESPAAARHSPCLSHRRRREVDPAAWGIKGSMSGHHGHREPEQRERIAEGRHRELRALLLSAADAARRSRRSAMSAIRSDDFATRSTRAIRERLSIFLVGTI
jgi:hypothetical protein